MSYTQGGVIENTDFNTLRTTVSEILGVGTADKGYGQTAATTSKAVGDPIGLAEWQALYTDVNKLRQHQTGTANVLVVPSAGVITHSAALTTQVNNSVNNRFDAAPANLTTASLISSNRGSSQWDNTIYHEVELNFASDSYNKLRYLFNAGGAVRIDPGYNVIAPDSGIDSGWKALIDAVGVISFKHTSTTASQPGTAIGFYDLTTSFQTVFTYTQTAAPYTTFGDLTLEVKARRTSTTSTAKLVFQVLFHSINGTTGDDFVTLDVVSNIECQYATGPNVTVTAPSAANTHLLSAAPI